MPPVFIYYYLPCSAPPTHFPSWSLNTTDICLFQGFPQCVPFFLGCCSVRYLPVPAQHQTACLGNRWALLHFRAWDKYLRFTLTHALFLSAPQGIAWIYLWVLTHLDSGCWFRPELCLPDLPLLFFLPLISFCLFNLSTVSRVLPLALSIPSYWFTFAFKTFFNYSYT